MQIDAAIAQLGQKMGVNLQLDDNRACRLVFGERLGVDFEAPTALPDHLIMTCVVGADVFPHSRETVLESLLQANLFGRETGGGVLALDDERGEVVLQRSLAMNQSNVQDLLIALELLLQSAEIWVDRLKVNRSAPLRGTSEPAGTLATMMRI